MADDGENSHAAAAATAQGGAGSRTPPRTRPLSRGRSRTRRGGELQVVHQSTGSVSYPMLTRTNYAEWAILMRVNMQAQGIWEPVEHGVVTEREDRCALAAFLRSVPPEMMRVIAAKDTARDAWNAVRTMRMGVEHVREAKAQRLRREFENLAFKDGESVEDFALRLSGLVTDLQVLGDEIDDERAVRKFLRVVPARYAQVAISIETLVDLSTLTIEELTGRLLAVEERFAEGGEAGGGGRLLLTEEEWHARLSRVESGEGSSAGGDQGRGLGRGKPKNSSSGSRRRRRQGRRRPWQEGQVP